MSSVRCTPQWMQSLRKDCSYFSWHQSDLLLNLTRGPALIWNIKRFPVVRGCHSGLMTPLTSVKIRRRRYAAGLDFRNALLLTFCFTSVLLVIFMDGILCNCWYLFHITARAFNVNLHHLYQTWPCVLCNGNLIILYIRISGLLSKSKKKLQMGAESSHRQSLTHSFPVSYSFNTAP